MKLIRFVKKILGKGGAGAKRYAQLYQTIDAIHPQKIMEVGTWTGGRAAQMIAEAAKFSPVNDIHYYGFDIFEDMSPDMFKSEVSKWPPAMATVQAQLEVTGAHVHLYKGNTLTTMPKALRELPKMDFVYIDGGHSIETIQSDWNNTIPLMHPGTVVIFDDYWPERTDAGCKPVVDAISRDKFTVEIMPVVDRFKNDEHGHLVIQFAKVTLK